MIAYVQSTHLEYRVSTTSASMLIPLFKPLCLGHISRLSKLGKRATIYPSLDRETVDRVVETSSPQKRWAERAQKDLEEAAEKEWRCSAVHQALTYSTRQRKTLLSLSLSLDISPSRLKGPHERRESIHLSIRGTQTRREGGRRSQRSRINKLDRSSGNFSIRSRCSWKRS